MKVEDVKVDSTVADLPDEVQTDTPRERDRQTLTTRDGSDSMLKDKTTN